VRARLGLPLLLLASCAVDEAEEVATYRRVLDDGLSGPPPEDASPLDVVGSMTLATLRHESLDLEGETYLQAIVARQRALSAFLPTIRFAPSYEWREKRPGDDGREFDAPVEGGLLVSPVRDLAAVDFSSRSVEERRALLLDAQDALLVDTARTHYEAIRAERALGVLENSLRVQNARVEDAEARLQAGIARPLDVSLSRAQAARTAADLAFARSRARNARTVLAFITSSPIGARPLADTLAVPDAPPPLEELRRVAEARRQDVVAAGRRIEAAGAAVRAAYGQYFPALSVDLQVFLRRDSEPSDVDWTSLFRVSLPLFSAGLIEADVRDALSRLRQARLADRLLRRAVARDVETSRIQFETAAERTALLRAETAAAREALDQAEGLYQTGLATNLERLVAQDRALSAELELVAADLERKTSWLELRRATGSLHELPGLRRKGDDADPR
jgi:outer membrane protein TolC